MHPAPGRITLRYASKADWDALARDLHPVYTAVNADQAALRFDELATTRGSRQPAIITFVVQRLGGVIPF